MVSWKVVYTKQARKDAKKIKAGGLQEEAENLLNLIQQDPFKNPPVFEELRGALQGAYSRRISYQHRLVYQVYRKEKMIKVLRMWTHYE